MLLLCCSAHQRQCCAVHVVIADRLLLATYFIVSVMLVRHCCVVFHFAHCRTDYAVLRQSDFDDFGLVENRPYLIVAFCDLLLVVILFSYFRIIQKKIIC